MHSGARIGVVDEDTVGVLPLPIVVGEYGKAEKKERKGEESETL